MPLLQDIVHKLDQGVGQRYLKTGLIVLVLAFVFVGDGLNDALNPRARER